jgi:hypothetical protein
LIVALFFFIFDPPQFMDFTDESLNQGGVSRKFDCLDLSHKVPVVVIMAVIVAKHAPVNRGTTSQVDVCKTVGGNFVVFKPDLLFQKRTLSPSLEPVRLTRRLDGRFLLRLSATISQIGSYASLLATGLTRLLCATLLPVRSLFRYERQPGRTEDE